MCLLSKVTGSVTRVVQEPLDKRTELEGGVGFLLRSHALGPRPSTTAAPETKETYRRHAISIRTIFHMLYSPGIVHLSETWLWMPPYFLVQSV
jgi:hypothetical protein